MIQENSNQIIHGMWIGTHLSRLELLSIQSFLDNGHQFWLWTYSDMITPLPAGVCVKDAGQIIPAESVFSYRHGNQFGHGKGSYAGFSDVFRYKLLYEYGGWWADMDITCLRPLDFENPYVFRSHDVLPVVGNLMKCPAGSKLMWDCYEEASQAVDEHNTDWMKPISILNRNIEKHHLSAYIVPDLSNVDRWEIVDFYRSYPARISPRYYVFHWMNEEWRSRGLDKNACFRYSFLDHLMSKHQVDVIRQSPSNYVIYLWKWVSYRLIPLFPRPVRITLKVAARLLKKAFFTLTGTALILVPDHLKANVKKRFI